MSPCNKDAKEPSKGKSYQQDHTRPEEQYWRHMAYLLSPGYRCQDNRTWLWGTGTDRTQGTCRGRRHFFLPCHWVPHSVVFIGHIQFILCIIFLLICSIENH